MIFRGHTWLRLAIFLVGFILIGTADGKTPQASKAEVRVTGLGWWRNRELRLSLERLLGSQRGETIDANGVEDAAFLLVSALTDEGFLKPVVAIEFTPKSGSVQHCVFDTTLATPMPRPFSATAVTFHVTKGVRYVVDDVQINGLKALPIKTAKGYFLPDQALFATGEARAYTPSKINRSVDALLDELRQRGYAEAVVREAGIRIDDKSGRVMATIAVVEGPRWEVASLRIEGVDTTQLPPDLASHFLNRPWSQLWAEDLRAKLRQTFYARGFPNMEVRFSNSSTRLTTDLKTVAVTATISLGPAVTVGNIRFAGNLHTQESVLRRRVQLSTGAPLDPLELDKARYRLSQLGVFTGVDLHYQPPDGTVRDPVYTVKESRLLDASLMAGYGSYEQARAGVELRQLNLFGLAHRDQLDLVKSVKSIRGEYSYTVPELFGETIDGTAKLFGLQRKEVSFLRREEGASLALKRPLPWFHIAATVDYTFQSLSNRDNSLGTSSVDPGRVNVGSIDMYLTSDRRDNPLRPRHGFRWYTQTEFASRYVGSEPDYQRMVMGADFHTNWGSSRWIHLGLSHGVILTEGARDDRLLPVNKRFYPGGESSIREGEASPRGADGRFLGAKTYTLGNLELEQALTANWSLVGFFDALGSSAQMVHYPFDEKLYSVGLGIRYQTLVGPVRLEYGHNIHRRPGDPIGTLHFSLGFPF
jgi:outer membrane protein assembly factor BamA